MSKQPSEMTDALALAMAERFIASQEAIAVALTRIADEMAYPRRNKERQEAQDQADRRARGW